MRAFSPKAFSQKAFCLFHSRTPYFAGILAIAFLSGACSTTPPVPETPVRPLVSDANSVVVMAFNVENLFDTVHDEGKDDYTYLPLTTKKSESHQKFCATIEVKRWREDCLYEDWSEEKLKLKMERLAGTILQLNNGKGADILMLVEVENRNVLEQLRKEHLAAAGYHPSILLEGPDSRGIDTAILSRFPLVGEPKLHPVTFKVENDADRARIKDTRSILQADLKLPDGEVVTVLVAHFPNPQHPEFMRTQAFEVLTKIRSTLPKDRMVLAGGDFNVTAEEDESLRRWQKLSSDWFVSHLDGCKGCQGTQYFHPKRSWSFLDAILFSKNSGKWTFEAESVQIVKGYAPQVNKYGSPERFKEGKGVSDHFPLGARLIRVSKP